MWKASEEQKIHKRIQCKKKQKPPLKYFLYLFKGEWINDIYLLFTHSLTTQIRRCSIDWSQIIGINVNNIHDSTFRRKDLSKRKQKLTLTLTICIYSIRRFWWRVKQFSADYLLRCEPMLRCKCSHLHLIFTLFNWF